MNITDWPLADRPREKMLANGESALTDAELLAILISTGGRGKTAVDLAKEALLSCEGDLTRLHFALQPDGEGRLPLKGIGRAKACTLRAAIELGRRYEQRRAANEAGAIVIRNSADIFALFNYELSALDHEELWAVYASRSGKVLQRVRISTGGTSQTSADLKQVVAPAIQNMASVVALCHNHPHSEPRPSAADRKLTEAARSALALFEVQLIDHLIIADGRYYSFHDEGDW